MSLDRRQFLARSGAALAAGIVAGQSVADDVRAQSDPEGRAADNDEWDRVRAQFRLSDDVIHMSALLIASHPTPVREAIEEHRAALDADPVTYLNRYNRRLQGAARSAAADYLGIDSAQIALTDSTTMGIGLIYNGLRLHPEQEILSSEDDYYVTHEAIRLASERTRAKARQIALYEHIADVSTEEIVERITSAITPATRVLALTWVHSSTGLKVPLAEIAVALEDINSQRDDDSQVLLCVDGVHGFGVEDATLASLGCDFFMAGCHKWLFGPRGTGIVAGTPRGWQRVTPTIPSFIDDGAWSAWLADQEPTGPTTAEAMTPGGFKAFEHQWAITQAFEFHNAIGKARVAERTHALAAQLKHGLADMGHVTLQTPHAASLSAGIVAFDVASLSPSAVVDQLAARGIVATVTPYAVQHVRLTPSIRNSPSEIDSVLDALNALG